MRISAINLNSVYNQRRINRNEQPKQCSFAKISQPLKADTVSFNGTTPNSEALRALLSFKIPDLYSPIILLDPETVNKIFEKHVFSSNLGNINKHLRSLTSSLFPVEYDFYNLIREGAKKNPNKKLHRFITELEPKHSQKLRAEQLPIFAKLNAFSSDFPGDILEQYNHLMYISERKINEQPVFVPFSIKEFNYKLNNIRKRISASATDEEAKAMAKLIEIAGKVPDIPKEKRMSPGFKITRYEDQQKDMISKFEHTLSGSVLKNDRDLIELTEIAGQRIYKVPTIIKFNRKSFIHDLQEITALLENRRLAHLVDKTAISLPTSKQSLSAFIMKAANRSDEQVGFDMLNGSLGTIDHLVASHNCGASALSNYALSSAYMNSLKAHKSFAEMYRHDKNIAEYAQAQIDRLIELAKYTKVFQKVALEDGYIKSLARRVEKLSKDPTLIIDTHELKY
jgi:hypothetical protein